MRFPASGVECSPLLPPAVAFVVAFLTASAGLSGAFLLLPLQMSVLGFTTPAVSATNLLYNAIAIPGGVIRYVGERRMLWPLAWTIALGTLPGVFVGAMVRIRYLADPRAAKMFVAAVLLYLGVRLLRAPSAERERGIPPGTFVKTLLVSPRRIAYEFHGRTFAFHPAALFLLALVVGVVGGIYGVGGGAIIAPFLVAVLDLPVYTIAGAALMATFVTSIAGVAAFALLGMPPDWLLGALFGLGGLAGSYAGASLQKYVPERWIRLFLAVVVTVLALSYTAQFFR